MELSSLYGPQLTNLSSSSSSSSSNNNQRRHRHWCNTTVLGAISNRSGSKSPLQLQHIHLPLRRPTKTAPPIIKPPLHKRKSTATVLDLLRLMDGLGLPVPVDMYTSLLKECTDSRDAAGAVGLHAHIERSGLRTGLSLLNRVLLAYVSCGLIENGRRVFDEMGDRDCNSWAAMVAGYMDSDDYEEAINLFIEMQCSHQPDLNCDNVLEFPVSWIIVCILKACVQTMNLGLGMQIHGWLLKVGYDEDLYVNSSLINLYGKLGCVDGADFVFDHMGYRNTVVWTAKLVVNCREERYVEALNLFKEMGREGVKTNGFTFSSVLRACGRMKDDGQCGQQVHAYLIKLGLESNDFVRCGLVDMYAKCGLLQCAERVFEMIGDEERTAACWNAMLTGYVQHGFCVEAIKVLYVMKSAGLEPRESLLNEVRITCGSKTPENNAY